MTKLTKRDKMRWKARVRKVLLRRAELEVWNIMWMLLEHPSEHEIYARLLIRQFKAAIRKVR